MLKVPVSIRSALPLRWGTKAVFQPGIMEGMAPKPLDDWEGPLGWALRGRQGSSSELQHVTLVSVLGFLQTPRSQGVRGYLKGKTGFKYIFRVSKHTLISLWCTSLVQISVKRRSEAEPPSLVPRLPCLSCALCNPDSLPNTAAPLPMERNTASLSFP